MISRLLAASLLAALVSACGTPAQIEHRADPNVVAASSSRSIDLRRIVSKRGAGEHVGQLRAGLLCAGQGDLTTTSVNVEIADREVLNVVHEELKAANYNMVGSPDDLFDSPAKANADYQLAAIISSIKGNLCFPLAGFGNLKSAKGEYAVTVEWQLFSRERNVVIFAATTNGTAKIDEAAENGIRMLQLNALRQAARGLLADERFREAVARGGVSPVRPQS